MNTINAKKILLGKNTFIHPTAKLSGVKGEAEKIEIGDNVYIGERVQILCDDFSIGDYSKIHHDTNIHGYKPCRIGHNAWIGQYSILDTTGNLTIGNNCGIGAHSQLWSHIKFGDTLEGCRFMKEKPLIIGNDVWFVGHCIVSPIIAHDKSMAMAGSVITKDMNYNEIYGGSPAQSLSHKIGFQFEEVSLQIKKNKMLAYLKEFGNNDLLQIVDNENEINFSNDKTYFNIATRKYKKAGSQIEIDFMNFLLPHKAKFIPY